jgi:hypothetical protein
MKRSFFIVLCTLCITFVSAQVNLDYYLPEGISYDESIPTPESIIGHRVGEWHITHDKLLLYMNEIARVSDRAILEPYGYTHEGRTLVHLVITSPENHRNLETLQAEHLKLCDPDQSQGMNVDNMPVFLNLGYSVHGNEASAVNSSLLTVYYLAAARGPEIDELLEHAVILVDPSINPDGLVRHSTWVNMHKSMNLVTDPNNRGFNEGWPGGRTNHYWFDLNRDWLLLTQPESRARIKWYHEWKPNVVTDHHEMGSGATFFFQPGITTRVNPLIPLQNVILTKKIAAYFAGGLDDIGSLYYSEERYDDFYFGKGSAYPDINSGIGILFEQAGIRGHARETENGLITFPFTIRNQFNVSLSTLEAGLALRKELLEHQKEFYLSASHEAAKDPVKGYLFGDPYDKAKTFHFIELLQQHQIRVYRLKSDVNARPVRFEKDHAFVVPLNQPQYRMIRTLFEKVTSYQDSTFYDVSAWTMPLYFNMPYQEVRSAKELPALVGEELTTNRFYEGNVLGGSSSYGYLFRWDEYYTPRTLYAILSKGLRAKVATQEFTYKDSQFNEKFTCGTIFIPVEGQHLNQEEIYSLLQSLAKQDGIDFFATSTGWTPEGIDLGSGEFASLEKPEILMVIGDGVNSRDAGEIWHQFDQRYHIPLTMVDSRQFSRVSLFDYNTLILTNGLSGDISERELEGLRSWLSAGNTLVAYKDANEWLSRNKVVNLTFKRSEPFDTSGEVRYVDRSKNYSIQRIPGGFFEAKIDLTHPVAYGYHWSRLPVFKTGTLFAEKSTNPYANPAVYTEDPLICGYISTENLEKLKEAPFVVTHSIGRGSVISILDNTNLRAVCYGTNKIFANAVFFGQLMR